MGSQVVTNLQKENVAIRCLTSSKDKLDAMPEGVEGHLGNLEKPDTLPGAFKGVDKVFLLVAVSQNETEQGMAAVEAAKTADVKQIVYMSVPIPPDSTHIPHFKSKLPIEEAIRNAGIAYTILKPNNFYQNDYWFKEAIMQYHVYPQPIGGVGLNRVDVRDIADAAINALTKEGYDNNDYPLHGRNILTGEETARIYSQHLGFEVRYGGDDLNAWEQQAKTMMPEWMVKDLRIMYQYFQEKGFKASEKDFHLQIKILGHEPRSFDSFVAETVQNWKNES